MNKTRYEATIWVGNNKDYYFSFLANSDKGAKVIASKYFRQVAGDNYARFVSNGRLNTDNGRFVDIWDLDYYKWAGLGVAS